MNKSNSEIIKINFRGGIASSEQLRSLLAVMKVCEIEEVALGERQNLFVEVESSKRKEIETELVQKNLDVEIGMNHFPNIVSSYASINLFAPQSWLTESVFKEALDTFDFKPHLKINLVDVQQGLVTAFDGDIIFIPSSESNFWNLYIRNPLNNQFVSWPVLLYSIELGVVAKELEEHLIGVNEFSLPGIYEAVKKELDYISLENKTEMQIPRYILPNYEGIHRNGDQSWIGIKNRSGKFKTDFLEHLIELCFKTSIGSIHFTPWRGLLVKNIKANDLIQWEILLGKFGINIRHSSFELNWRTRDFDSDAENLKKYLIREFDKADVRTYGITFGITMKGASNPAASVIIEMKPAVTLFGKFHFFWKFNVHRTENFNPNAVSLVFAGEVSEKRLLADKLKLLCEEYYKQLAKEQTKAETVHVEQGAKKTKQYWTPQRMHKCKNCLTIYDSEFGDAMNNIAPGISFEDLPETYTCSVCGAAKNEFMSVRKVLTKESVD